MFSLSLPSSIDGIKEKKWSRIVKCSNNCLYCIPHSANEILKIDPSINKTTLVGGEYVGMWKWSNGFAHGDFVYGIQLFASHFFKYNIETETSELVGDDFADDYKWMSGAVADDGCLYCFPYKHKIIVKFNPNNDTTSFVGEEFRPSYRFNGTIKAKNGCLYGILFCFYQTMCVAKFHVATQKVTFIGDNYGNGFGRPVWEGGVVGDDDNIYGIPFQQNVWSKINIATETTSLVANHIPILGTQEHKACFSSGVIGEDCNI